MATSVMDQVLQHLRSVLLLPEGADLTDGQLLECFLSRQEPAALEALMRRHGPMVWGVCRRILGNHHDAEDAFQATFLVLVRKASSVRPRERVGNWLYGVAHQTALKARATRAKRRRRERSVPAMPEPAMEQQGLWNDLQPLLDQELGRLPENYRAVVVACDLEGQTGKEAARHFGCPEGTVASRLARARAMLAKRLARHGLGLTGVSLAAVLSEKAASGPVPSSVMAAAIRAVTLVAAGQAAATGVISAKVATLTDGVIKAMLLKKLKTLVSVLVVVVLTGFGGAVSMHLVAAQQGQPDEPSAVHRKGQGGEASPAPSKPPPQSPVAGEAPRPPAENRDPEKVFQKARARLLEWEPKHDLLKGVADVKPVVERDEKGRLKQDYLIFERNAVPPGKGPAKARDESLPFVYVSIQVWAGRTQQPPGDLHEFEWKGQTYQMWVRVFGSDAKLVEAIRKAVDVTSLEPPEITFRLETSQSPDAYRKGKPLVFEGQALGAIHRPGPEHFKLARVAGAQGVPLRVAYDREKVERRLPGQARGAAPAEDLYPYNSRFKGVRVLLYNGAFRDKDPVGRAGILDLYGCPLLQTGVRYRLTWACWPVGASEAVEVSCEFALNE
jgi:RNA polymerase sigma factor (sigma-70 family)